MIQPFYAGASQRLAPWTEAASDPGSRLSRPRTLGTLATALDAEPRELAPVAPASHAAAPLADHAACRTPVIMACLDSEFRYQRVTHGYAARLGCVPADLVGKVAPQALDAATFKELRPILAAALAGHEQAFEMRLRLRSGEEIEVAVTCAPDLGADGQRGVVLAVTDLAPRKRFEASLRESEDHYRRIVESATEGIWSVDGQRRTTYLNPSMAALLGASPADLLGRPAVGFLCDIHATQGGFDWEARGEGEQRRSEVRIRRTDGSELRATCTITPQYDEHGQFSGAFGMFTDITEQHRAELTMRRAEEKMRQSQKMDAIGQFVGGVAHDFNNLLTAINGYSDLLLRRMSQGDPLRRRVEEIRKAGDRGAALMQQLLMLGRKQVVATRTLDLNTIATDMEKFLRPLLPANIELRTWLGLHLAPVRADPGQVEQIILNLANNARDAMARGGCLTIHTANATLTGQEANACLPITPGPYVMLSVQDTGLGMGPEIKQHLFEPFFTTKEKAKGTGLGLSTVYGIVKQNRGSILVRSQPRCGSTVEVYLPAHTVAAATCQPTLAPLADTWRGVETILLVEDEPWVRGVAAEALQSGGYTVLEADCAQEALDIHERHPGDIHLLLSDVVMPGMSGRELAQHLRPVRPGMRVLHMSGYTDDADLEQDVLAARTAFLAKPFSPDQLLAKVRELLDLPCPEARQACG